jgi:hypothetical protein
MITIKLSKNQFLKGLETTKAYAIQYSKYGANNVVFLSKKHVTIEKMTPLGNDYADRISYKVSLPKWYFELLSEKNRQTINFIIEENHEQPNR